MRNLLLGLIDFRLRLQPRLKEIFQQLAISQKPDCLFVACSDSRVVPNLFASTNPGEMFVIRNVGNLIPRCVCEHKEDKKEPEAEISTGAAIEYSVLRLNVKDIIVCGHSNCGAMKALMGERDYTSAPYLKRWISMGEPALSKYKDRSMNLLGLNHVFIDEQLPPVDQLSQMNVLQQVENLLTFSVVRDRVLKGQLSLHAWWFDIRTADVFTFSDRKKRYELLDEKKAEDILSFFQGVAPSKTGEDIPNWLNGMALPPENPEVKKSK